MSLTLSQKISALQQVLCKVEQAAELLRGANENETLNVVNELQRTIEIRVELLHTIYMETLK